MKAPLYCLPVATAWQDLPDTGPGLRLPELSLEDLVTSPGCRAAAVISVDFLMVFKAHAHNRRSNYKKQRPAPVREADQITQDQGRKRVLFLEKPQRTAPTARAERIPPWRRMRGRSSRDLTAGEELFG